MTPEEYFTHKNGGKPSDESTADEETFTGIFVVHMMESYMEQIEMKHGDGCQCEHCFETPHAPTCKCGSCP